MTPPTDPGIRPLNIGAGAKKTCPIGWAMGAFEYRQALEILAWISRYDAGDAAVRREIRRKWRTAGRRSSRSRFSIVGGAGSGNSPRKGFHRGERRALLFASGKKPLPDGRGSVMLTEPRPSGAVAQTFMTPYLAWAGMLGGYIGTTQ